MRETAPPSAVSGKPPRRGQDPARATNLHEAPVWHCCPGYSSGGRGHVGGENTNNSGQTGPGATLALRPRLTSRETWPPGRKKRPRARNARPNRRRGSAACDICPVVLFHSGGSQISGGDMIERPSHPGSPTFVFATPVSTYRAEKKPRMAEKSDERPR